MTTNAPTSRRAGGQEPRLAEAATPRRRRKRRSAPPAAPIAASEPGVATPSVDTDSANVVDAMARVGTTLAGKWRLHVLLGVGGMAAVYGATHRNGHRVAIKVLHTALGRDRSVRERFLREGYVANLVDHDGVARVLDDDELEGGSAFLVMELLTGETLETRWQRAGMRLPLVEVLGIADELLAVLGAAHDKGIQHRDVKPENVFLTRAGELKILDFGIARMKDAAGVTATQIGTALGTPAFMPPEQALGRSDEIDGRSDLWAVGATMFTLLSGRLVHLTDSPSEMLVLAATERAPASSSVLPHLPASVAAILDRALSFERDGRFADAPSMRLAVREARIELGYLDAETGGADDAVPAGERATLPSPSEVAPRVIPDAPETPRVAADVTPAPRAERALPRRGPARLVVCAMAVAAALAAFATPVPDRALALALAPSALGDHAVPDDPALLAPEAAPPAPIVEAPSSVVVPAVAVRKLPPRPTARAPVAKRGPTWVGYKR